MSFIIVVGILLIFFYFTKIVENEYFSQRSNIKNKNNYNYNRYYSRPVLGPHSSRGWGEWGSFPTLGVYDRAVSVPYSLLGRYRIERRTRESS